MIVPSPPYSQNFPWDKVSSGSTGWKPPSLCRAGSYTKQKLFWNLLCSPSLEHLILLPPLSTEIAAVHNHTPSLGTGDGLQSFIHSTKALYQMNYNPTLSMFSQVLFLRGGIKPRAAHTLCKCSTTELYPPHSAFGVLSCFVLRQGLTELSKTALNSLCTQ